MEAYNEAVTSPEPSRAGVEAALFGTFATNGEVTTISEKARAKTGKDAKGISEISERAKAVKPNAGETEPKPDSAKTAPKPGAGEAEPKPGAGEAESKPGAGETAPKPGAGETEPKPGAGETEQKPDAVEAELNHDAVKAEFNRGAVETPPKRNAAKAKRPPKLKELTAQALCCLSEMMADESNKPADRLNAVKTVLDYAGKLPQSDDGTLRVVFQGIDPEYTE